MPTPTISLDDLTKPLTREEVQTSVYQMLSILGVNTTTWKPGAVVRAMITAYCVIYAALSNLMADLAKSGFLALASESWLTLVARYVYGVERDLATFAPGVITITNGGGGVYTLDPGDLVVSNPSTGKTYRNTAPISILAGPGFELTDVAIEANESGAASTSGADQITDVTTPLLGVTVTNPTAVVGRDDEKDPELRARCTEKLGSLSPFGPWDAYSYAARNTVREDGTNIGVKRVRITKDGMGNVNAYLATDSGAVPGTVGDLATDLGLADEAIQQKAAPLGVTANTFSASNVTIAVTYEVWMYNTSGYTPDEVEAQVLTRLATFMSTQPIGGNVLSGTGKVYVDAIRTQIGGTLPQIFHVVVTVPGGDTTLATDEVPVLGTVTATAIHQVAPPEGFGG